MVDHGRFVFDVSCFVVGLVLPEGDIVLANFDGRALRGGRPDGERKDASVPRSVGATPQVRSFFYSRPCCRARTISYRCVKGATIVLIVVCHLCLSVFPLWRHSAMFNCYACRTDEMATDVGQVDHDLSGLWLLCALKGLWLVVCSKRSWGDRLLCAPACACVYVFAFDDKTRRRRVFGECSGAWLASQGTVTKTSRRQVVVMCLSLIHI